MVSRFNFGNSPQVNQGALYGHKVLGPAPTGPFDLESEAPESCPRGLSDTIQISCPCCTETVAIGPKALVGTTLPSCPDCGCDWAPMVMAVHR